MVSIFVASRVLVLLISVASPFLVPRGLFSPGLASTTTWQDYWTRWDAGWYIGIARRGYEYNLHDASSVAFFPCFRCSCEPWAGSVWIWPPPES